MLVNIWIYGLLIQKLDVCIHKQLRTILREETGDMDRMRRETNEKEEEEEEGKRNAIKRERVKTWDRNNSNANGKLQFNFKVI